MHANEIHPDSCSLYWTSSVLPSPNPHLNASNFDKYEVHIATEQKIVYHRTL